MPTTAAAVSHFEQHGVVFGPAKAANAGGVAVSGLEMVQNRVGLQWTREEVRHACMAASAASCSAAPLDKPAHCVCVQVCEKLKEIMTKIYTTIKGAAEEYGTTLAAGRHAGAATWPTCSLPAMNDTACCLRWLPMLQVPTSPPSPKWPRWCWRRAGCDGV